jgi:hypothetical protein
MKRRSRSASEKFDSVGHSTNKVIRVNKLIQIQNSHLKKVQIAVETSNPGTQTTKYFGES